MSHAQHERLVVAMAAVFKHHAMLARLFRSADDPPAILDRIYSRNFNSDVLAVFHGKDRLLSVPTPRRCNQYEIDVIAREHALVVMRPMGIKSGLRLPCCSDQRGSMLRLCRDN